MPARLEIVADQDSGAVVVATQREVRNSTITAVGTETRRALRSRASRPGWPVSDRPKRGLHSITQFRTRKKGDTIRLLNITPSNSKDGAKYPFIIEFNPEIRGTRNRNFRAAFKTIRQQWPQIGRKAQQRAVGNVTRRAARNSATSTGGV